MDDFDVWAEKMDAGVDRYLGNSLIYAPTGGAGTVVKGFLIDPADGALEILDESMSLPGGRVRLKLNAAVFAKPTPSARISPDPDKPHRLLEGVTWKPGVIRKTTNGRYWIMDLQKA